MLTILPLPIVNTYRGWTVCLFAGPQWLWRSIHGLFDGGPPPLPLMAADAKTLLSSLPLGLPSRTTSLLLPSLLLPSFPLLLHCDESNTVLSIFVCMCVSKEGSRPLETYSNSDSPVAVTVAGPSHTHSAPTHRSYLPPALSLFQGRG